MQKNLSGNSGGQNKALRYVLMAFVAVSIGAAVYKMLPSHTGGKAQAAPAEALPAAPVQAEKAEVKAAAVPVKAKAVKTAEDKTAVVYYFYTNTRCSSCKTIEAYTREAVATKLSAGYKGWKIEFKGVNVDLPGNKHFIQDYWLNSKSVVVQKLQGDKPLNWGLLGDVWQLLGDKESFMNYVASGTKKVIDSK